MANDVNRIGLSISPDGIRVVEIIEIQDRFILNVVDEEKFSSQINFLNASEAEISASLIVCFQNILSRNKFRSSKIFVSLYPGFFYCFQIPYESSLLESDLNSEIIWEFKIMFPHEKEDNFVFDKYIIPINYLFDYNSMLIAALRKNILNGIEKFANNFSLEVIAIDSSHFAFEKALQFSLNDLEQGINLSVYFCYDICTCSVLIEGKLVRFLQYKIGEFDTPLMVYERLINGLTEIGIIKEKINKVFFGGEDIPADELKMISEQIGLTLVQINPFARLPFNSILKKNIFFNEKYHSFYDAAGAAVRLN